jgi:hypothetical protein
MINFLKKLNFLDNLNEISEVDESRRRVIKGALALAALAAIPINPVTEIEKSDYDRFMKMVNDGLIEGMTFYLDRSIVLEGFDKLRIDKCHFILLKGFEGKGVFERNKNSKCFVEVNNSIFDTSNVPGGGVPVLYQEYNHIGTPSFHNVWAKGQFSPYQTSYLESTKSKYSLDV